MASTDITVSGLSRVGAENAEYLISKIRTIPGFPKEGILFRDFMPVLADARAFGVLLDALEAALLWKSKPAPCMRVNVCSSLMI